MKNIYDDSEVIMNSYPDDQVTIDTPKEPGFVEGLKSGFMGEKGSGVGHFIGENALPIAGATIGGLVALPTATLSAGATEAAGIGLGAAGGKGIQHSLQQLFGKEEKGMDVAKSMAKEGASQAIGNVILGPAAKQIIKYVPKVFGWTSGLGSDAIERIQARPSLVIRKLKDLKNSRYELEDSFNSLKKTLESSDDSRISTMMKEPIERALKDSHPGDALAYELSKLPDGELKQTVLGMSDDFIEKKISYDTTKLLSKMGIVDVASGGGALAAYGLLNLGLIGSGALALGAKSPAVAGLMAAGSGLTKKAAEKIPSVIATPIKSTIVESIKE